MSWIRSPLFHFLFLGALIFVADGLLAAHRESSPALADLRIDLDGDRIVLLEEGFRRQTGRIPEADEVEQLIDAEIDDEILFREATRRGLIERDSGVQTRLIQKMLFLDGSAEIGDAAELLRRARELGLHKDDIVVRRILVQKMRLLASVLDPEEAPTHEEISAHYENNEPSFREPDRVQLIHLFFGIDERGEASLADALAVRRQLIQEGIDPEEAIRLGDPFPLGHRFERRTPRDLERSLGGDFAGRVFDSSPLEWSMPIESAYGQHLVWIEGIEPGGTTSLEAMSDRIRHLLARQKGEEKLSTALLGWRQQYDVFIDGRPRKR